MTNSDERYFRVGDLHLLRSTRTKRLSIGKWRHGAIAAFSLNDILIVRNYILRVILAIKYGKKDVTRTLLIPMDKDVSIFFSFIDTSNSENSGVSIGQYDQCNIGFLDLEDLEAFRKFLNKVIHYFTYNKV